MRRTRRRAQTILVVPAAALALVLAGCGGGSSDGSGSSGSGSGGAGGGKDTLTLGMNADIQGWDPASQPGYQGWPAEAVWDQLVKCDEFGELTEDVADEWSISEDNRTFTAHIREGMQFSDGTPVDSAAVEASFTYVTESGGAAGDYEGIEIDAPDAQNVSITFPEPQPTINNKMCAPKIVPATVLESEAFDVPVGSGPYVMDVDNTTRGSVYTFTKNENHWNTDEYPYQTLVCRVLESAAAAVSALKTGQIDASLVEAPNVAEAEASGLDVLSFQGQTTRLLLTDHLGQVIPALGDVRVRQAINMVFDKQAMVESLYLGQAEPTAQVFRQGSDAYIEDLEDPYPYDVDAAKALMAEAGYADGFTLELPTMDGQNHETLMPYVTQQLAEINIEVTQVPLSGANAISDLLSGKFPVVLWQLGNLGNSALQIYIEMTPEGYWDLLHQPDEYVDSRWEQIKTADEETATTLQQEINRYVVDQAWFAPMVYMGTHYAYDADKVSIPTQSDQEALTPKLRDFK